MRQSALSHLCVILSAVRGGGDRGAQVQCAVCQHWIQRSKMDGHTKCWPCRHQEHKEPAPVMPPAPLFDRDASTHALLSQEQRFTIVALHRDGRNERYIADRIPCDVRSVRYWLLHHEKNGNVDDLRRSVASSGSLALMSPLVPSTVDSSRWVCSVVWLGTRRNSVRRRYGSDSRSLKAIRIGQSMIG